MTIPFVKFQGTGNDFILIDGRETIYDQIPVKQMCDRNFGIGADGLMILTKKQGYDFEMIYFNSDGNLSSMCGNGGRCIVQWAHQLGIKEDGTYRFWAPDGAHEAIVKGNLVSLKMTDVKTWQVLDQQTVEINTGSPHYVYFGHENLPSLELVNWARSIRYNDFYQAQGINVNAVIYQLDPFKLSMRTYERGVENETLSCGTGVTAAVLSSFLLRDNLGLESHFKFMGSNMVHMNTKGGELSVTFEFTQDSFQNIWLVGPATFVFQGTYETNSN